MNKIKLTALPCICADVFYGTDMIRPGGEALNFAAHASYFKNVDVTLLGIVGKDKYAEVIMDSIETLALDKDHIRIDSRYPTANNMTYLTGSGDSYHAGFVCSYMLENDIEKAMETGSKIAAETLKHYGGF